MRYILPSLLLGLIPSSVAIPTPSSHVLHEKRHVTSPQWVKRDRMSPEAILPVRIGLKQNNLHKGPEWLMDVSDPTSPNYAKYWSLDDITQAFAPANEAVEGVKAWLIKAGIASERIVHSTNRGWLAFEGSTAEVESLLYTHFHAYEDRNTGAVTPACEEYHVPNELRQHIDYITPGIRLLGGSKRSLNRRGRPYHGPNGGYAKPYHGPHMRPHPPHMPNLQNLSTCDIAITPACVRALYEVPLPPYRVPNPSNSLGIFEEGDMYEQRNLDKFFANFTPYIPQGTHPTPAFIDGATAPGGDANDYGESDLDFSLSYPLIWPQTITLYQTDDSYYANLANTTYTGGFNTFLDALDGSYCTYSAYGETGNDPVIDPTYPDQQPGGYKGQLQCGVYKPTNVISVSYGGQEAYLPDYYQQRQCNEYLKLGLQGTTIVFASGDSGVSDYPQPYGFGSVTGCLGPNLNIFNPTWPNNCPWLTNVGATKVYPGRTVYDPESAVYDPAGHPYAVNYSSGGGFSNLYSTPDYQKAAVATYFAEHNPPYPYYEGNASFGANGGLYNRLGRGIPDVAANGDNIAIYNQGNFTLEGGTSASTPIFASIINRINEERLAIGKAPVGFINPTLYQNPWVLNDITNGSNPGCNTLGFSAVPGWDPVTGLGTPNYPRMLELFLRLP